MSDKGATLTELLEIAQGKITSVEERNEAEVFFDENSIVAGVNWVDDRLVYWKYLKWCAGITRIPIDRKVFIRATQKRFKRLTSQGKCYFKLDKQVFAVSEEEWNEVKQDYNLEKRKHQWRKNQQKAQQQRRKKEKLLKREARKRKKEPVEKTPLVIPDLKNNSSQE